MVSTSTVTARCRNAADSIEKDIAVFDPEDGMRETEFIYPNRDLVASYAYALETVATLTAVLVELSGRVAALEKGSASGAVDIEQLEPKQKKSTAKKKPT